MPEETIAFKAEIEQLLDILVHSLYTEREVFLRELLSNSSDALHRFQLESLTAETVQDPGAELGIWLRPDPEAGTLRVRDSGVGMSREALIRDLGTIAHSGARAFSEAMQGAEAAAEAAAKAGAAQPSATADPSAPDPSPTPEAGAATPPPHAGGAAPSTTDLIGRFGVGFYSVFMVAREAEVISRSLRPQEPAARWHSNGTDSYTVGEADETARGTEVILTLRDDAKEFLEFERLRQIVRTHSNYVPFPIYLWQGDDEGFVRVNEQKALWREREADVTADQHKGFLGQLRFGGGEPLLTVHFQVDAPIQLYALLYVPATRDPMLSRGPDGDGLRLYARKVLIDESQRSLLPRWLRFMVGVVDSEDLPLNVSRESVQATPLLGRIRTVLAKRVVGELAALPDTDPERFTRFLAEYGPFLKEAIATDPGFDPRIVDLLRFRSSLHETTSLADYVKRMPADQSDIYFVQADDAASAAASPHLEPFRHRGIEVLLFTEPLDAFLPMGLPSFQEHVLRDISEAELELPAGSPAESPADDAQGVPEDAFEALLEHARSVLGDRVAGVRASRVLERSAARLVAPAGTPAGLERLRRLTEENFEVPPRVLELNRQSDLVRGLAERLQADAEDELVGTLLVQLWEGQLLAEGLHPNPASMATRLESILTTASRAPRTAANAKADATDSEPANVTARASANAAVDAPADATDSEPIADPAAEEPA